MLTLANAEADCADSLRVCRSRTSRSSSCAGVTQADVQRLQDNVYLADRDISQLRSRDTTRANQLVTELDDLRDEVVYLKVKLRKERTLSRTEYADVRDRIEDLRSRARGDVASVTARTLAEFIRHECCDAAPRSAPAPVTTPAPAARSTTTTTATACAGDSGRHRNRRSAPEHAQLRDRTGRGSLRSHDCGGCHRRWARRDSVRFSRSRRRDGSRAGDTHQPHGEDDGQLRSGHRERPLVSDSRNGHRRRSKAKASGARRDARLRVPASARSSAASWAGSKVRSPASSSAAAARSPRPKARKSSSRRAPSFASDWIRRSRSTRRNATLRDNR